ncbi:hypothetical protein ElyMa_006944900 [Elysia marginata]|uniref:Uncharacterized protein n=1 Tax=Elysia marginata TaxID=1093978 RepID=A0AAV4JLG2_9GAST|nr:hypothetical protein ElyMa_006944900 [Elysia marginata]
MFGHIDRADGIEKQKLCGKICVTKVRRRQRTKYTDSLTSYATRKESTSNELIRRSEQRGMEGHDPRCLKQTWHIKKKKTLSKLFWIFSSSVLSLDRLCGREVRGSIPGRVKPRTLKLVLAADPPCVWYCGFSAKSGRPGVRIM